MNGNESEINEIENENRSSTENLSDETQEQTLEPAEAKLEEELAKEKDKFLRLFAEFENYKK